jgi:hypothetical protein
MAKGSCMGLNAIVISTKERYFRLHSYLKDLQAIIDGGGYLACTITIPPDEVEAVTKDNFTP